MIFDLLALSAFYFGLKFVFGSKSRFSYRKHKSLIKLLKLYSFDFKDKENILRGTGMNIERRKFEIFRAIFFIFGLAFSIYIGSFIGILILISLFISSKPVELIFNHQSPFGFVLQLFKKGYLEKVDIEIYEAISLLKNMIIANNGLNMNSDYIIEQLAVYSDLLRHTYFKMLNLLRLNKSEEAIKIFCDEAGSKISKDFGRFLIQIDKINPRELEEILISLQKNIREERITKQKRKDEIVSDILYLPVVINVLLIFINFIYVSYFVNQKNIFSMLIN